jgi:alpha-tubulin suppressor-like RCC1 family protein
MCGAHECSRTPVQVIGGHSFGEIDAGFSHTCAATANKEAYCWGSNDHGELGTGLYYGGSALPEKVQGAESWLSVVAGTQYSCGVADQGVVKCWGSSDAGTLGAVPESICPEAEGDERCSPVPVTVETTQRFSVLSAGDRHICGITKNLTAFCWGDNANGQMGLAGVVQTYLPSLVEGPEGSQLIQLSAGGQHSCGITSAFETYCWGINRSGQLGGGYFEAGPFLARLVDGGLVFATVGAGGNALFGHTCGLTPERRVYCWGSRDSGRLGDGR